MNSAHFEQRWKENSYDEDVFPGIAAEALGDSQPNRNVSPWEILHWFPEEDPVETVTN